MQQLSIQNVLILLIRSFRCNLARWFSRVTTWLSTDRPYSLFCLKLVRHRNALHTLKHWCFAVTVRISYVVVLKLQLTRLFLHVLLLPSGE